MTRYELTFRRTFEVRYVGHLDFARVWERTFRRAQLPVEYSHGFNPHPKIAFAAPLPVGMTAAADLLDVTFATEVGPADLMRCVAEQLPAGIELCGVAPLMGPALAARLRLAVYRAKFTGSVSLEHGELEARIAALLDADSLPCERERWDRKHVYDLRPLIADLWWEETDACLGMRLVAGNSGTGRPDDLLQALGLEGEDLHIERSSLILAPLGA